jgi:oligopeptidase B
MCSTELTPPVAKIVPANLEKHGQVRTDNYYWLNERENPEVVAYLEAENAYTEAVMAHTQDLQNALFEEIKGRIKQRDMSVPYRMDGFFYYTRYEEGKEYPIHCRKKGTLEADEELRAAPRRKRASVPVVFPGVDLSGAPNSNWVLQLHSGQVLGHQESR